MSKITFEEIAKTLTFGFDYSFLEEGKDDAELAEIAEKRGLSLPCNDLAIFKGKFAFTDRTNLNGCSLPKEEVTKSLHTLIGKAIDFDHIRERIVGFWIDAEVIADTIYAYGAFFKANLAEDYMLIKELMDQKNLGISFEAYGTREFKDNGTYDLNDIEWAGGALLINTEPAFPGAGVTELASKRQRVLEFASTMTEPETYIKSNEARKIEKARLYVEDMDAIMRMLYEVKCPMCKSIGYLDVNEINFQTNTSECTCWMCNANLAVDMTPKSTMMLPDKEKSSRKLIKVVQKEIKKSSEEMKKEESEMSEVKKDAPSITKAEEKIEKPAEVEAVVTEEKVTIAEAIADAEEEIKAEEKEEVTEVKPEEVVPEEKVPAEEKVAEEVKPEEVKPDGEDKVEPVVVSAEEVTTLKNKILELEQKLTKARDEGKVIGERKMFLADYAKDMTDDDILDDDKYDNASLRKKVAELEANRNVEVSHVVKVEETLEIGSKDKEISSEIDEYAKKVRKRAFNL